MKTTLTLILAGLVAAGFAFTGCTVVGLALGAAIDGRHNSDVVLPIEKPRALKPDDNIVIKRQNGLEDVGIFIRIDTMRMDLYELSYKIVWNLTTDCYLPFLPRTRGGCARFTQRERQTCRGIPWFR